MTIELEAKFAVQAHEPLRERLRKVIAVKGRLVNIVAS